MKYQGTVLSAPNGKKGMDRRNLLMALAKPAGHASCSRGGSTYAHEFEKNGHSRPTTGVNGGKAALAPRRNSGHHKGKAQRHG